MKSYRKHLLTACAALLFPLATIAADAETQLVTATGYGMSVDEAKKAAVRAAVESVVGTLVDAETLVENDELVQDKILSYSAGMVDDVKIIGEPTKASSGLVTVRAQVKVRKTELAERVKSTIKTSVKMDGESLYQKALWAQQNLNDAAGIMQNLFKRERLQGLLNFEVDMDNDSPLAIDTTTGEVTVSIKGCVNMEAYKQWTDEIIEKLGVMATDKAMGIANANKLFGYNPHDRFYQGSAGALYMVDRQGFNILRSFRSLEVVGLQFDKDKMALLNKLLNECNACNWTVSVSLLDKMGEKIKSANVRWPGRVLFYGNGNGVFAIVPAYAILKSPGTLCRFSQDSISLGQVEHQDLREIDSISVEVSVTPGRE